MEPGQNNENDILQLGGNIELSGFKGLSSSSMIVLKKIVGNYARKMSESTAKFEKLSLTMKTAHSNPADNKPGIYEINAKMLDNGKLISSSTSDRNLFVAIDDSLKKIMSEISK